MMKAGKNPVANGIIRVVAVMMSVCVMSSSAKTYDVLVALSGSNMTKRYSVSADGLTWTEQALFSDTVRLRGACAIGDGYVYAGSGSAINRYDTSGKFVNAFKTGISANNVVQIVPSPDRVWFYTLPDDWGAATAIQRYRISNPDIGGNAGISGPLNIRHMMFGRDGLLYFGTRGSNDTSDSTGVKNKTRGGFVYDTSFSVPVQLMRYIEPGYNNGAAICPDLVAGKVYITAGDYLYTYDAWDETPKSEMGTGANSNIFCGLVLDELYFFAANGWNGRVMLLLPDGTWRNEIKRVGQNLVGLSDITAASTTGTKLPEITAVWYLNETSGTRLCNGAVTDGSYAVTLNGDAVPGVKGVAHKALALRPGSYGVVENSNRMLPGTGDFTLSVWAYIPEASAARTIFSNGSVSFGVNEYGRLVFACGTGQVVSTDAVTGKAWHLLTAVRRSGGLEVWVDGERAASAELSSEVDVSSSANWTIGRRPDGSEPLGGVVLDELRVYPVALPTADISYLYNLPLPRPGAVTPDLSLVAGFGTVVDHFDSVVEDAPAPSLVIDSDGIYHLAAGQTVYTSSDQGANWTVAASGTGLEKMSVFVSEGKVHGLGVRAGDSSGRIRFATRSADGTWSSTELSETVTVPGLSPTVPVFSNGRIWLGAIRSGYPHEVALFSCSLVDGTAGDPVLSTVDKRDAPQYYGGFTAAVAVETPSGDIGVFASVSNSASWVNYGEIGGVATNSAAGFGFRYFACFPGASKPMAVKYDEASGRYWAVTVPEHIRSRPLASLPQENAATLAIYSSPDLVSWRFHGDVIAADPSGVRFSNPSIDFDGDSLVIAFATAADDGAVGLLGLAYPNFIQIRKVPGFRSFVAQEPEAGLLVAEASSARVMRYAYDPETEDWLAAGVFAEGVYGTRRLSNPNTVHVSGNRVYIGNNQDPKGTFVFDRSGRYLDFYENGNPEALLVQNGYLYSSDWFNDRLYRTELSTGEVSRWMLSGVSVNTVRAMVALPDGSIALASRATMKVERVGSDGTWIETLISSPASAQWQSLTYDATNHVLWAGTANEKLLACCNPVTKEVKLFSTDWTGVFDLKMYDGRLMAAIWNPGRVQKLTQIGTNITGTVVIGGGASFGRFDVYVAPPKGCLFLVR